MTDYGSIKVSCSNFREFPRALSTVLKALPPEMSKRLRDILLKYLAKYGMDDACKRMNGRSVSQIFAEYQPVDVKPVVSGEVDGVRYNLYKGSRPDATDNKGENDE